MSKPSLTSEQKGWLKEAAKKAIVAKKSGQGAGELNAKANRIENNETARNEVYQIFRG